MTQSALRRASTPFSDVFLSHLYRAAPGQVAPLVADLSPALRVQLAVFCFSRAHLRAIGREIAAACEEADLRRHAPGAIGACLCEAKRAADGDDDGSGAGPSRRPRVTLATAADMRRKAPLVTATDAEDDDETDELPDSAA